LFVLIRSSQFSEKDDEQIAREIQKKYSEEINKLQRMQQEADEVYSSELIN
jgi:membrane protein insertase Oxa1/YidC/SpoIIIJ